MKYKNITPFRVYLPCGEVFLPKEEKELDNTIRICFGIERVYKEVIKEEIEEEQPKTKKKTSKKKKSEKVKVVLTEDTDDKQQQEVSS
jgi:hypothetical protein